MGFSFTPPCSRCWSFASPGDGNDGNESVPPAAAGYALLLLIDKPASAIFVKLGLSLPADIVSPWRC